MKWPAKRPAQNDQFLQIRLIIAEQVIFSRSFGESNKIAPSAINLDFYNDVHVLSPFGSGNPEPKFIVEDLKPLNSKIVGDNHIKSVLIGPEGTCVKTIAFNAANNELGAYLLKKNNKKI